MNPETNSICNSVNFENKIDGKLVEKLIKENLPLSTKIVSFSKKELSKLAIKELKRCNEFGKDSNVHNSFKEKFHCIFDLIYKNDEPRAMYLLKFIDEQFYNFVTNIQETLRSKAISKIKAIVLTEDIDLHNNNNPSFLNYFGEIVAINYILNYPDNRYTLKDIEYKLNNNKQIDFLVYDSYYEDSILVEIMNLHFQSEKLKLCNLSDFTKFLQDKINNKYKDKTNELSEIKYVIKVLPIIWNNVEDFVPFKSAFKDIDNSGYSLPLMFVVPTKSGEVIQYKFKSASCIFESQ